MTLSKSTSPLAFIFLVTLCNNLLVFASTFLAGGFLAFENNEYILTPTSTFFYELSSFNYLPIFMVNRFNVLFLNYF